ncbi:magnesium transporter [Candidatus Woesearchaeota archaeon]|nr:magnesium transporter [Candidatus Woesearchaeota archaeon]
MRKEFLEISVGELISVTGGILAGTLLATLTNKIFIIPGIFILMPGFLEMKGNIFGSLAARLGTGLHLGTIGTNKIMTRPIIENVIASFLLSIIVSIALGLMAYVATIIFFKSSDISILFVSILASIISSLILIPLTVKSTLWLYKRDYDPNNIMGPYVTTVGDVVSIVSILLAILIVI